MDDRNHLSSQADYTNFIDACAFLKQAQTERTRAVCQFLEARAKWQEGFAQTNGKFESDDGEDECGDCLNLFVQAEREVQETKSLYCAAIEQNRLMQRLLRRSRNAFRRAQENLERLAMEDQ